MKIKFENVDFSSRSGPNGFGLKLARQMVKDGHEIVPLRQDVQISFIQRFSNFNPTVLRLDGIYFNLDQDWKAMNAEIKKSYDSSQSVVVQSLFDYQLINKFFGSRDNVHIIQNGTDLDLISQIPSAKVSKDTPREKIWMCASAWRPHKRLKDNIRLFLENADDDSILLVAGSGMQESEKSLNDHRIRFLGDLAWDQMISCMKIAGNFIHLAWLDHCPNVVIDAKACGCTLHVSNAGGTVEIAGPYDRIYKDEEYLYEPVKLYEPPRLNFEMINNNQKIDPIISIQHVANQYYKILESCR